jgi:hypothetical protein
MTSRIEAEEAVVWEVCPYLRRDRGPYLQCPRWETAPTDEGLAQRGCFALAHEVVMICRTGNPWGRA